MLYESLVGTVKESYLLQLSVALYTFGSRSAGGVGQYDDLPMVSRDEAPTADSGSGTHSHWPDQQCEAGHN